MEGVGSIGVRHGEWRLAREGSCDRVLKLELVRTGGSVSFLVAKNFVGASGNRFAGQLLSAVVPRLLLLSVACFVKVPCSDALLWRI